MIITAHQKFMAVLKIKRFFFFCALCICTATTVFFCFAVFKSALVLEVAPLLQFWKFVTIWPDSLLIFVSAVWVSRDAYKFIKVMSDTDEVDF